MDHTLSAIILGIIEGLTEFLPVSSTGHLIITGHLLGFTGLKADVFEVVIQLGAILAVVILYWPTFLGLLRPDPQRSFTGARGIFLLMLTSLPASVLGLLVHKAIKIYLFTPQTVAWALAVGALAILLVEGLSLKTKYTSLESMTPRLALGIGCFQCLALWPGFSRSASTILGGMLLGADRKLATEYSFIAAVPIMIAATGFDLLSHWTLLERGDMLVLVIGFVFAFVSAWAAVKLFISLVQKISLRPFAYYRLILAPLVLYFWS
jgi:undecaprenyl-diphosphatase